MPKIKNIEKIKEEFVDMLIQFDKDRSSYHTDVYMYYDNETQTARLSTFTNVGNNSWLDDDHIIIYTDSPHNESIYDFFPEVSLIADVLEIPLKQLEEEALLYQGYEKYELEEVDVSYHDISDYIDNETEKGYIDKLYESYYDSIESEFRPYYVEKADEKLDSELKYYGSLFSEDENEICLIRSIDDTPENIDALNEFLDKYNDENHVSLEQIKDLVDEEDLIIRGDYGEFCVNTEKLNDKTLDLTNKGQGGGRK